MQYLRILIYSLLATSFLGSASVALAQDCLIGEVKWFGGNFAPRGWAILEGQLLSVNQNQALYSILGTTYGGDGRTTFGLPDLRGRFLMGRGQGPGLSTRPLGQKGGKERHKLTLQEIPGHTHTMRGVNKEGTEGLPGGNLIAGSNNKKSKSFVPTTRRVTNLSPATISSVGGNQPHDVMPPYTVLTSIMCLQGVFPSRN